MSKPNDQTGPAGSTAPQAQTPQANAAGAGTRAEQKPQAPQRPFQGQPRIQPAQGAPAAPAAVARPLQAQPLPVRVMPQPAVRPQAPGQAPALRPNVTPLPAQAQGTPAPVRPTVPTAQLRRRHWWLLASFVVMVVLPTLFWAWYLWARASDQYVSTVGFAVHKEGGMPSIDLLGGLGALAGGASSATDSDVLYEYIRSQDMVEKIDQKLNLREKFSRDWPRDFIFSYNPDGHIEDLTDYWPHQVKVLYDTSTSLITLKVLAFTPEDAQEIAQAVFQESADKINQLSSIAREDTIRLATEELDKARGELTRTRQALTDFRIKSQIVDPAADMTSQMGVLSGLQAQLAEQLVAHDLLMDNAKPTDHRVTQSQLKIDALRKLIEAERAKFGSASSGPAGESYSQLMAEFEKLSVDREFAEGAYRAARVAYETALAEAQRKSRYLAAHIEPKVAQSSTAPDRPWLLLVVAGLLLTGWSILVLIYYSIRDRA